MAETISSSGYSTREEAEKLYQEKVSLVNKGIEQILSEKDLDIYHAARHYLNKGKNLRALILLLSCGAAGGTPDMAIQTGIGIELLHTFSLIQDDIMDNSTRRRGVETVHKVYGENTAILASDYLYLQAFSAFTGNGEEAGFTASKFIKYFREIITCGVTLCEGQFIDLDMELDFSVTEDTYFDMIYKKTAVFFEKCCTIGALIADADQDMLQIISDFGKYLGLAFQIKDDLLSLYGDPAVVAKSLHDDITDGKMSLPMIKVVKQAREEDKKTLVGILKNKTAGEDEIETVKTILNTYSVKDEIEMIAHDYCNRAKDSLETVPDSYEKEILAGLANFVMYRNK